MSSLANSSRLSNNFERTKKRTREQRSRGSGIVHVKMDRVVGLCPPSRLYLLQDPSRTPGFVEIISCFLIICTVIPLFSRLYNSTQFLFGRRTVDSNLEEATSGAFGLDRADRLGKGEVWN